MSITKWYEKWYKLFYVSIPNVFYCFVSWGNKFLRIKIVKDTSSLFIHPTSWLRIHLCFICIMLFLSREWDGACMSVEWIIKLRKSFVTVLRYLGILITNHSEKLHYIMIQKKFVIWPELDTNNQQEESTQLAFTCSK